MTVSTQSTNPTEAYKKALEVLGLYFGQRTGLDVVMLRVAGIFGPLYHSMANLPSRLATPRPTAARPTTAACATGRRPRTTATTRVTSRTARSGIQLAHIAPTLEHRIYNVGNGKVTRNSQMAEAIREVAPEFEANLSPGGAADDTRFMDLTRISTELGYQPHYGVERGLAEYVEWLRTHPQ